MPRSDRVAPTLLCCVVLQNLRGDEVAVLAAWSRREGELREEGAKAAAYEADVGRTSQEVEELKVGRGAGRTQGRWRGWGQLSINFQNADPHFETC